MLKNYFNDDKLFESVYNEGKCGAPSGHCGADKLTCGGGHFGGCGFKESVMKESSDYSSDSYAIGGCGALGYVHYCKVGRFVVVKSRLHGEVIGELLGYVPKDIDD